MSANDHKVHVARNGSLLGSYEYEQLGDMLERGQLQKSDHYYDDTSSDWVLLSEWKGASSPASSGTFKRAPEVPASADGKKGGSDSRRRGGKSRGSKKGNEPAIAGWIACLLAVGLAAGIWAYAATLQEKVRLANEEISSLKVERDALRKENQFINELSPAGRVRAVITYEPAPGQIAIMSGATIGLYAREEVDKVLQKLRDDPSSLAGAAESFEDNVDRLKAGIPSPIELALTDSSGRVDLEIPEPGDYVLVASAGKTVGNTVERYLWLIGFRAADQPSPLVLLGEKNAASSRRPKFEVIDLVPLQTEVESGRGE